MEKQFVILYTGQKLKKAKTWHDGVLKHSGTGTKAVLQDDNGRRLDTIHVKIDDIVIGDQLESDRYFILIEDLKQSADKPQPVEAPISNVTATTAVKPSATTMSRARCAGLKRKNSGFMPPRVVKQPCLRDSQTEEPGFQSQDSAHWNQQPVLESSHHTSFYPNMTTAAQGKIEGKPYQLPRQNGFYDSNEPASTSSFSQSISTNDATNEPSTSVGRNLISMYKQFGGSSQANSSQESIDGLQLFPTKQASPWSVYGSKNSSPDLSGMVIKAGASRTVVETSPDRNGIIIESHDKNEEISGQHNEYSDGLFNAYSEDRSPSVNGSQNQNLFMMPDRSVDKRNVTNRLEQANSVTSRNYDIDADFEVKSKGDSESLPESRSEQFGNRNSASSNVASNCPNKTETAATKVVNDKRNMLQIMKLLGKKEPSREDLNSRIDKKGQFSETSDTRIERKGQSNVHLDSFHKTNKECAKAVGKIGSMLKVPESIISFSRPEVNVLRAPSDHLLTHKLKVSPSVDENDKLTNRFGNGFSDINSLDSSLDFSDSFHETFLPFKSVPNGRNNERKDLNDLGKDVPICDMIENCTETNDDVHDSHEVISSPGTGKEKLSDVTKEDVTEEDDLTASFHINFSPLSHVTDSDSDVEKETADEKDNTCKDIEISKKSSCEETDNSISELHTGNDLLNDSSHVKANGVENGCINNSEKIWNSANDNNSTYNIQNPGQELHTCGDLLKKSSLLKADSVIPGDDLRLCDKVKQKHDQNVNLILPLDKDLETYQFENLNDDTKLECDRFVDDGPVVNDYSNCCKPLEVDPEVCCKVDKNNENCYMQGNQVDFRISDIELNKNVDQFGHTDDCKKKSRKLGNTNNEDNKTDNMNILCDIDKAMEDKEDFGEQVENARNSQEINNEVLENSETLKTNSSCIVLTSQDAVYRTDNHKLEGGVRNSENLDEIDNDLVQNSEPLTENSNSTVMTSQDTMEFCVDRSQDFLNFASQNNESMTRSDSVTPRVNQSETESRFQSETESRLQSNIGDSFDANSLFADDSTITDEMISRRMFSNNQGHSDAPTNKYNKDKPQWGGMNNHDLSPCNSEPSKQGQSPMLLGIRSLPTSEAQWHDANNCDLPLCYTEPIRHKQSPLLQGLRSVPNSVSTTIQCHPAQRACNSRINPLLHQQKLTPSYQIDDRHIAGEDPLQGLQLSANVVPPHPSQLFGRRVNRTLRHEKQDFIVDRQQSVETGLKSTCRQEHTISNRLDDYSLPHVSSARVAKVPFHTREQPNNTLTGSIDNADSLFEQRLFSSQSGNGSILGESFRPGNVLQRSPFLTLYDSDWSGPPTPVMYNDRMHLKGSNDEFSEEEYSDLPWQRSNSKGKQHIERQQSQPLDDDDEMYQQIYQPRSMYPRTEAPQNENFNDVSDHLTNESTNYRNMFAGTQTCRQSHAPDVNISAVYNVTENSGYEGDNFTDLLDERIDNDSPKFGDSFARNGRHGSIRADNDFLGNNDKSDSFSGQIDERNNERTNFRNLFSRAGIGHRGIVTNSGDNKRRPQNISFDSEHDRNPQHFGGIYEPHEDVEEDRETLETHWNPNPKSRNQNRTQQLQNKLIDNERSSHMNMPQNTQHLQHYQKQISDLDLSQNLNQMQHYQKHQEYNEEIANHNHPITETIENNTVDSDEVQKPKEANKWNLFLASQNSDEIDVNLEEIGIDSNYKGDEKVKVQEFVVLQSSPGLYNTQCNRHEQRPETRPAYCRNKGDQDGRRPIEKINSPTIIKLSEDNDQPNVHMVLEKSIKDSVDVKQLDDNGLDNGNGDSNTIYERENCDGETNDQNNVVKETPDNTSDEINDEKIKNCKDISNGNTQNSDSFFQDSFEKMFEADCFDMDGFCTPSIKQPVAKDTGSQQVPDLEDTNLLETENRVDSNPSKVNNVKTRKAENAICSTASPVCSRNDGKDLQSAKQNQNFQKENKKVHNVNETEQFNNDSEDVENDKELNGISSSIHDSETVIESQVSEKSVCSILKQSGESLPFSISQKSAKYMVTDNNNEIKNDKSYHFNSQKSEVDCFSDDNKNKDQTVVNSSLKFDSQNSETNCEQERASFKISLDTEQAMTRKNDMFRLDESNTCSQNSCKEATLDNVSVLLKKNEDLKQVMMKDNKKSNMFSLDESIDFSLDIETTLASKSESTKKGKPCKQNQTKKSKMFSLDESLDFSFEKDSTLDEDNKSPKNEDCKQSMTKKSKMFCLDESMDLSFDCGVSSQNGSDSGSSSKKTRPAPTIRIGWKPPVKSNTSTNKSQEMDKNHSQTESITEVISSQKMKPTFTSKCLRLMNMNKKSQAVNPNVPESKPILRQSCIERTVCDNMEVSQSKDDSTNTFRSPNVDSSVRKVDHSTSAGESQTRPLNSARTGSATTVDNECKKTPTNTPKLSQPYKPPCANPSQRFKLPTRNSPMMPGTGKCSPNVPVQPGQGVSQTEFRFPSKTETEKLQNVMRQVVIPATFQSVNNYKQTITAALTEYVNTHLLDVAKRYHHALSKVDTSSYCETQSKMPRSGVLAVNNPNPVCQCGVPSKMVCVKKEGPNCGRYFYACSANRNQQCKYFQWTDENRKGGCSSGSRRKITDIGSLNQYMKSQHVPFYGECQFIKRVKENINKYFKPPKWVRNMGDAQGSQKKLTLLKLPYKGRSSMYAKDDIWIISQQLDFNPAQTFIAKSTYYGPSSSLEVEIEPMCGYSPSNWTNGGVCHAILATNSSTELNCLENIREHIQAQSPPVLPHLLNRRIDNIERSQIGSKGFQAPRMMSGGPQSSNHVHLHSEQLDDLANGYITKYGLNPDQSEALRRVANMFSIEKSPTVENVLLIHGVFGAGKSFLLSVMVLFLVEVFKLNDSASTGQSLPWKLLISSTTNVAVDRILNGLLDLGFEDFVRVGSVKKIAKPVLPYSVHASGTDNQELKDLQEMLRSGELTNAEKSNVRQSIEKHRRGENKKKLGGVRVVGATCAACSLNCLNQMEFPLVLLDECSQMTEPASLLPVAKFGCQKLLLVGDPKQLDPTIQGCEAAHQFGLEQTLFDRLIKMGCIPTLLRTQYRCHPHISAISNSLFYGGMLEDGVTVKQRKPLLDILPTVCCYDVNNGQECCESFGSYYNENEAKFVVFLLQVLLTVGIEPTSIGVITLYKSQMSRISDLLGGQDDYVDMKGIQVSTVDAFQGGERDIIILSTVRTDACGFIDNDKRMNVALSRAKHHLLIVGNVNNLSRNILWSKVLNHCKNFVDGIQSAETSQRSLQAYMELNEGSNISQYSEGSSTGAAGSLPDSGKPVKKKRVGKTKQKTNNKENQETVAQVVTQESIDDAEMQEMLDSDFECTKSNLDSPVVMADDVKSDTEKDSDFQVPVARMSRKRKRIADRLKPLPDDSDLANNDDDDELPSFDL